MGQRNPAAVGNYWWFHQPAINKYIMGFNEISPRKMVIYWDLMGFTLW
jgi:hypothetical protein